MIKHHRLENGKALNVHRRLFSFLHLPSMWLQHLSHPVFTLNSSTHEHARSFPSWTLLLPARECKAEVASAFQNAGTAGVAFFRRRVTQKSSMIERVVSEIKQDS